ncbi:MAG TPA: ComF family protein [Candidatus Dormibacteraeota bacterium]
MRLLDLIFPPRCAGCLRPGHAWCARCAGGLRPAMRDRLRGVPLVAAGRLEGPFQQAIHTYKYRPRPALAGPLAEPLLRAIRPAEFRLDALTFVPLHPVRQRRRGFNQSERLATELARPLGTPILPGLARVRATPPQVGLSEAERRANLAGAFRWVGPLPAPRAAGLVDDVCTTGATLEAAAEAIEEAGGRVAAFLVLAVAQTLPGTVVTFPGSSTYSQI